MADDQQQDGTAQGAAGQDKGNGNGDGSQGQAPQAPQTLATWLEANDKDGTVAQLHDAEVANLKKALQSERENAKKAGAQLREAAGKAEGDVKAQLNALADERDAAVRRAEFYAVAVAAGCTNVDAAYHVAQGEAAWDSKGRPNIEAVRAKVPELFGGGGAKPGAVRAGQGTGGTPPQAASMNDLIRRAAGRAT
jgi:hypothetical protein